MLSMKNKIIFIIIVLLVCAGLGFYFYEKLSPKTQNSPTVQGQFLDKSMNTVNIGGVIIQGEGDMKALK